MMELNVKETMSVKIDRILHQNGFLPSDIDGMQTERTFPNRTGILYQDPDLKENVVEKNWFGLVKKEYTVMLRKRFIGIITFSNNQKYFSITVFGRKYMRLVEELGNTISVALNLEKSEIILTQEEPAVELYQSDVWEAWD